MRRSVEVVVANKTVGTRKFGGCEFFSWISARDVTKNILYEW